MSWKVFDGAVRGFQVAGDSTMPPTRIWNHLWLALFRWNKVAVFRVFPGTEEKGYRIGYSPQTGSARLNSEVVYTETFSVKQGHEPCTFFAIDMDNREIPLELVLETRVF